MILDVTDITFEKEVIQADILTLVFFWAEWAEPVIKSLPVLEEINGIYGDRLLIAKLNVNDNPMTPTRYGIREIPTTLFMLENSFPASGIVGELTKEKVIAQLALAGL